MRAWKEWWGRVWLGMVVLLFAFPSGLAGRILKHPLRGAEALLPLSVGLYGAWFVGYLLHLRQASVKEADLVGKASESGALCSGVLPGINLAL